MYRGGHVGFNALLYAPALPAIHRYGSLELAVTGAILAVGLATLPDIDEQLPWIRHRGPTHTIWFAGLVGLCAGIAASAVAPSTPFAFRFGVVVGAGSILAHLAGDVVTPMGICPFAPLSDGYVTLEWFRSKHSRINRGLLLLGSIALLASLGLTVGPSAVGLTVGSPSLGLAS